MTKGWFHCTTGASTLCYDIMNAGVGQSVCDGTPSSSISSAFLDRIRARQPEAWRRLVDLYGPVIYGWCRRAGAARDDAADLVQEVFAAITLHIDRFHRDRPGDSFTAWLSTLTRNMIRDHFRLRRGRAVARGGSQAQQQLLQIPDVPDSVDAAPSQSASAMSMPAGLELVRAEFESRTWEVFHRAVIRRQPPVQIAHELGMTVPAVYQAKSRVLRRLRRELGGLLEP